MRPEYYADLFRRYAVYCRNHASNRLFKIAGGPSDNDLHWTEVLMRDAGSSMDGLSLHYYVQTRFGEAERFDFLVRALRMDELVSQHSAIMD